MEYACSTALQIPMNSTLPVRLRAKFSTVQYILSSTAPVASSLSTERGLMNTVHARASRSRGPEHTVASQLSYSPLLQPQYKRALFSGKDLESQRSFLTGRKPRHKKWIIEFYTKVWFG